MVSVAAPSLAYLSATLFPPLTATPSHFPTQSSAVPQCLGLYSQNAFLLPAVEGTRTTSSPAHTFAHPVSPLRL